MLSKILVYSCLALRDHMAGHMFLEDQHLAFSGTKTLDGETPLRYLSATLLNNTINLGVCMARIVVEQHQTLGVGLLGDVQGVKVGRMAPADAVRVVFFWCVLGILDEEISITRQGHVMRRLCEVPRGGGGAKGFVVRGVRQDFAVDSEAVAQGTAWMIDDPGFDRGTIREFYQAAFAKLDKLDLRRHGMHWDGKVWTAHLARDDLGKRQMPMLGAQDRQFRASDIGWGKKRQTLNVIPVGMA